MSAATNLRPGWKPGQSGNPGGQPALPPELRAIRSLTQRETTKLISKYARMSPEEIAALVQARAAPVLELAIASIFMEAVKRGDFMRLNFLLERAIGKVPLAPPTDAETAHEEIANMSDEELFKLVRERVAVVPNA